MKKWKIHASLCIVSVFFMLLFVSSPAPAETVLKVGIGMADAGQLDPHISAKTQDKCVFGWMFNGLVRLKPGSMDLNAMEPDLAERWVASADSLVWTFYLRKGVKFHGDYGEFTAEDVVYSLQRAKDPKTSGFSSDYANFIAVEAVDPYTVKITLDKPVPSLLALVSNYHGGNIVSKKAAEAMGEDFKTQPVGTGPFAFVEYKSKQNVTLAAHKDYFRGTPKIDKIIYRYIPSAASRELAFTKGELDLTYGVRQQQWVDRMRKKEGIIVDVFQPGELRTMHMNMTKKPFDDIRVRKAVAHAISRDEVAAFLGKDVTQLNFTVVPNGYLGHSNDVVRYEYDVDKAKALLKEAGYPDGFKAVIKLPPPSYARRGGEIVASQLGKIGIKLEIVPVEWAQWLDQVFKKTDYDLTIVSHTEPMDIGIYARETYYFNYKNPEFQDVIAKLSATADTQERYKLMAEAQRIISDDCVNGFLFQLAKHGVWNKDVKGLWENSPVQANDLTEVYWAK